MEHFGWFYKKGIYHPSHCETVMMWFGCHFYIKIHFPEFVFFVPWPDICFRIAILSVLHWSSILMGSNKQTGHFFLFWYNCISSAARTTASSSCSLSKLHNFSMILQKIDLASNSRWVISIFETNTSDQLYHFQTRGQWCLFNAMFFRGLHDVR